MDQIYLIFKPQNWSLLRIDKQSNELYFVVCEGKHSEKIKNLRLKIGEGIVGKVAETGKELVVLDADKDEQFNKNIDRISSFKTESLVAVPIMFKGEVLGIIELINVIKHGNFSDSDLEILRTIADFSAIAINNSINYEEIIFLATHDPLTRVYNRAFFEQINTSSKDDYGIFILVDIDNFKMINDQHSHLYGDKVLMKMAEILTSLCRKSDYVFRVGGDEFLIIINHLNENDLDVVADKLQRRLQFILEKTELDFSFSYGISRGKINELEHAIQAADIKMYEFKHKNARR